MTPQAPVLAIAIVCLAFGGQARERPDFAGVWTLDVRQSGASGGGTGGGRGAGTGRGGGMGLGPAATQLTITQDDTTLTIQPRGGPVSKIVYRLDGKETAGAWPAGPTTRRASFRSAWKDGRLVTLITTESNLTYEETISLDERGLLVVAVNIQGQANARVSVYRRKA